MGRPLRVLIIEDSDDDAILVVRELRRGGYEPLTERVETAAATAAALERLPWDVVLADYSLPSFGAPAALALLKQGGLDVPFIVVSGSVGEEIAVAAMKAGAHDYFRKDNLARLVPAIERELREAAGRRERRRAEEALRFLAEAGMRLAASLDYEATLRSLSELIVPRLADGYTLDLVQESGPLERAAVAFIDPAKAELARELHRRFPRRFDDERHPVGVTLRTGRAALAADVSDADVEAIVHDPACLAVWRQLGVRSYMIVPLVARGRVLGALSFAACGSARRFGPADLALAKDLAQRAALAVDNARLFRTAQQAIREARAAVQLRDDFLARASHELRTPLTSAFGTLRLLQRALAGGLTEAPEALLDTAIRNLRSMTTLLGHLLDVAKLDADRALPARDRVDLHDVLKDATRVVAAPAREKGVALEANAQAPLVVWGDAIRLEQVFVNLLVNGVKFTPAGGRVWVEAEPAGAQVVARVRDTGIGIAPEYREAIFEPFVQAAALDTVRPGDRRRRERGTGLGLAICRRIVTLHGGQIWAESEGPGRGSTFVVRLPAAAAEGRAA
jgi:signal transduction histidine kinase